jgi:uncharacterized protein with von Willebrand factor type A (vWA) domain
VPESAAVAFARVLRGAGLPVPTGASVAFARALAAVGVERPDRVYWAGRATLVRRPEDTEAYDRAFVSFFGGAVPVGGARVVRPVELQVDAPPSDDGPGGADGAEPDPPEPDPSAVQALRWSATEILRGKDLAACTPDELDEAHRLIAALRVDPALRRSRRRRPERHGRGRLDLGRTVRRSLRTGGETLRPASTVPGTRPRRLVLLLDVSGSMEPYSRGLARLAHAAVSARRRGQVEVFALGTRVTRITRELSSHDPDEALRRAAAAVADWSGGTRLGEGLRRFNDRWGVRGLARGAVVVILSDGWDRGDPGELGAEMARLHRVTHRLVWVNPLKASPAYAPLARGMAAALPHVDAFVEGHSVASLEALGAMLGR